MSGFYEPLWLFALLVIPVLAGIYYYVIRKKKQEAIAFSRIAFVKSALGDAQKSRRTHLLFIIALAAIGLLVIALADPHIPLEQTKEGVNVILVIDDSGSMQATDYQPTRLEAAKSAAELLVGNLDPKDSAGVILFESGATTVAYLSEDKERVQEKIAAIAPRSGETAIGDGLALAVDMAQSEPNKKSVIILLSDGVNNAGVITPDEAMLLRNPPDPGLHGRPWNFDPDRSWLRLDWQPGLRRAQRITPCSPSQTRPGANTTSRWMRRPLRMCTPA